MPPAAKWETSIAATQGHIVALSETDTLAELVGAALSPVAISETVTVSDAIAAGLTYLSAMEEGWEMSEGIFVAGRAELGDRLYRRPRHRPFRQKRRH